jgi:hypothetical protein
MSFVLAKQDKPFWYKVEIPVVTETGGSRTFSFEMLFNRFSRSEVNRMFDESKNRSDSGDTLEADVDYVMNIAKDWRHISDEDGKPVPFVRDAVFALLDQFPNAASKITSAFFEATLSGGARVKN